MDINKSFRQPQDFVCGWISPEGKLCPVLPKERDRIADALCRELYGVSPPLPGEYLLDIGWLRVHMEKRVEFQHWPTDTQYDALKEYGLTRATARDECMFRIPSYKAHEDIFLRKDCYSGEPWYSEFCVFHSIGICRVPEQDVFEVREALARFGFPTHVKRRTNDEPGYIFIISGPPTVPEDVLIWIKANMRRGKSYRFTLAAMSASRQEEDDVMVCGSIRDCAGLLADSRLTGFAKELCNSKQIIESVDVSTRVFSFGEGEPVDMTKDMFELVDLYGPDNFIKLPEVRQIDACHFTVPAKHIQEA